MANNSFIYFLNLLFRFEYQGLDPAAEEDLEGLNTVKNYAHCIENIN